MVRGPGILAILAILAPLLAFGEEKANATLSLGPVANFKVEESKHFRICFQAMPDPDLEKLLERTWRECDRIFEGFEILFAGTKEAPAPKKMNIYLADGRGDFERIRNWLIQTQNIAGKDAEILKNVTQFAVPGGMVFQRAPVLPKVELIRNAVVHGVAQSFLRAYLMRNGPCKDPPPLCLVGGFGYYMEFKLLDKAVVRYIDFDKYYAEQGGNKLIQSEPLKEDNWARAVKQAARKTATLPAPDVILGIDVDRLTPDMCGTMYAFISYCVSSAPGCKSTIAKDLLEAYACADAGKWNEAWRFYVLSERFK